MHGHAKGCEAAKSAVATYLHYETNELRRKSSPISSLKAKIRITHAALEKNGPSPILTAKINTLHNKIEQARATFSHTTQTAKNNTAKEELLTKECFSTFKSRTNNGDIAEIYKLNHGTRLNTKRITQPITIASYYASCANTTPGYTARSRR
jgi:thymidylate synthase